MNGSEITLALAHIDDLRPQLTEWRRSLHQQPELSGEEERTAAFIAAELDRIGVPYRTQVGGQGVVGLLRGERPGETVAYRADMDALPIQEIEDRPYRALPLGISHACGHDAHVAIALGVAEALMKIKQQVPGTVKFIFQPAEESLDGARAMIEDDVLKDPRPNAILALHAFPIPAGTVGVTPGLCLAGMREFRVRFYAPAGNLPILIDRARQALEALSTAVTPNTTAEFNDLVRRMIRSDGPARTTFLSCWRHSEGSLSRYHLLGLVSTASSQMRQHMATQIRQTLDDVTDALGASYDLTYTFSNPPLRNDPALIAAIAPALESLLGVDNILHFRAPYPFAHEDFSHYAEIIPGALIWLGTANPEAGIPSLLHTPAYDIDEASLAVGAKVAVTALWQLLNGHRWRRR